MKQHTSKIVGVILALALLFLWPVSAMALLPGQISFAEYGRAERLILSAVIFLELVTFAVLIVYADKLGKALHGKGKPEPTDAWARTILRRSRAIPPIGAGLVLVVGVGCGLLLPQALPGFCTVLLILCCVIPVLILVTNLLLAVLQKKRFGQMRVEERNQMVAQMLETAAETQHRQMAKLNRLKRLGDAQAVLLALCGIGIAALSCITGSIWLMVPVWFYAAVVMITALSQIRLPFPKVYFEDEKSYVDPADYPCLYALTRKAADQLGCEGPIHLAIESNCNAGISKIGDRYSVVLGLKLLMNLTEEELYAILLHEFAHVNQEHDQDNRLLAYLDWLMQDANPHFLSSLTMLMLSYIFASVLFHAQLYRFSTAVLTETQSDKAMAQYGNAAAAASALVKLRFHDFYAEEQVYADYTSYLASEEQPHDFLRSEIQRFRDTLPQRKDAWLELMRLAIPGRSDTHPTTLMRLKTLGVEHPELLTPPTSGEFAAECDKALTWWDQRNRELGSKTYAEDRKSNYLEPMERIQQWEAAGKPVEAETYSDYMNDLFDLGRMTDALTLADAAIAKLEPWAACDARFHRGAMLLHRHDPAGLDDLYAVLAESHNYNDEALDLIGAFCCKMGMEEELMKFRSRATEVQQNELDGADEIGKLNRRDDLSEEHLPQELMDGLMACIESVANGKIRNVYLVRKTIRDDLFTSAVVVRFFAGTGPDDRHEIMHAIFRHLDTSTDWQYSLFEYYEVEKVHVERIPNSCIYAQERD